MNTNSIAGWTYESVEYSDGIYHTVFDENGMKVCDCMFEHVVKRVAETRSLWPLNR